MCDDCFQKDCLWQMFKNTNEATQTTKHNHQREKCCKTNGKINNQFTKKLALGTLYPTPGRNYIECAVYIVQHDGIWIRTWPLILYFSFFTFPTPISPPPHTPTPVYYLRCFEAPTGSPAGEIHFQKSDLFACCVVAPGGEVHFQKSHLFSVHLFMNTLFRGCSWPSVHEQMFVNIVRFSYDLI